MNQAFSKIAGVVLSHNFLFLFTLVFLFLYGELIHFVLGVLFVFLFMSARALSFSIKKRIKSVLILFYGLLVPFQILFLRHAVFTETYTAKTFGILLLLVPLLIERFTTMSKYTLFKFPSLHDAGTISFFLYKKIEGKITRARREVGKIRSSVSTENIRDLVEDLHRHSSTEYINSGSLPQEYFANANRSLEDPHLYIVISNTGSPASEIISVFTRKPYNHVSLSFDRDLTTIVSYNGGEKVFPPGLNREMIEFFHKKEDASVMVYRLHAGVDKKRALIQKIEKINAEGSAYNILGLVMKYSHRPNIMFCSQFVYTMLKSVDLAYFDKKAALVEPTDFVELDYRRKLGFEYEIQFH